MSAVTQAKPLAGDAVGVRQLEAMVRAAGLLGERQRITRSCRALPVRKRKRGRGKLMGSRWPPLRGARSGRGRARPRTAPEYTDAGGRQRPPQ